MNSPSFFIKKVTLEKNNFRAVEPSSIIYEINCKICDANYVGQTRQPVLTRLKEHMQQN